MDCDDNDFQSQNFELAGEDNNRFPQTLRSFSLPKFNFDDHLQVHLRFDGLAETEGLLGMQGQEDNWIEEFSPGRSAIEFSSNAAESCSITRHNNVWFEATSSESVEMLWKSVGDELLNKKITGRESNLATYESSCRMEDNICNDLLGSNEDVIAVHLHDGGTFQNTEVEKLEMDLGLDEKLHVSRKVAAEQCTAGENLKASSDVATKECIVVEEFLEVVQSDNPLDNASMRNSLSDDSDCPARINNKVSLMIHTCTQDAPSVTPTDSMSIVSGVLNFEQIREERHDIGMEAELENLQPDDKPKETCRTFSVVNEVETQYIEGRAVNNDACNIAHSSNFEPCSNSLTLLNEDACVSGSSKNSDCLLNAIAYNIKAVNDNSRADDNILAQTEEMSSAATERDGGVERDSVEVGNEDDMKKLSQNTLLTEDTKVVGYEEESATLKSAMADRQEPQLSDNNCNELISSSSMVVDLQSALIKQESRLTEINDGSWDKNNSLNTMSSDSAVMDKTTEDDLEDVAVKSNREFGASGQSIVEKSSALVNNMNIKTSFSVEGKSIQISDISNLVEFNKDNAITVEPSHVKGLTNPSLDLCCSSSNIDSLVVLEKEITSSDAQDTSSMKEDISVEKSSPDKAVEDVASVGIELSSPNNLALPQHLHSKGLPSTAGVSEVKEAVALSSLPASDCIKDANISSLSAGTSRLVAVSDAAVYSSAAKSSMDGKGETAIVGKVCMQSTESSVGTFGGTCQGKEANFAPENICNRRDVVQTKSDALGITTNYSSVVTVHRSNVMSADSLNPENCNQGSFEANCGSPTVFSCNERGVKHREDDKELPDPIGPALEAANVHQVKCTIPDRKESTTSEDDGSFTFEVKLVSDPSHKDTGMEWKPFPDMRSSELPQISRDNSKESQKSSKEKDLHSKMSKATEGSKKKQAPTLATRKVGVSEGDSNAKSQQKQAKGREKSMCSMSPGYNRTVRSKTQEVVQQYPCLDSNSSKSSCSLIQASNLPDLNSSVSSAASFNQPFTDLQQVQLRAQIFVYGSLIQGAPPDEACMISAFGGTDGGRSLWEGSLQAASERFSLQKSPLSKFETPMHSRKGGLTAEQASNFISLHSKALNFPAGQSANKVVPSVTVNSTAYWPSPLWSKSCNDGSPSTMPRGTHLELNQSVSPLHAYQSSQNRQCTSNASSWLSHSPRPPLWVFPSQSSPFDVSSQYSAIPVTEKVQVTPIRDSSVPRASNVPLTSPGTLLPSECPGSLSTSLDLPEESQKKSATAVSSKNESAGQKSRRKKKVSASEELGPTSPVSQLQKECASAVDKPIPASASFSLPTLSPSAVASSCLLPTSHSVSPTYFQIIGSSDVQQRVLTSDQTLMGIEQSKMQAENACAQAVAAVKHSQDIWGQLASQRESGMVSEVEEKLASAAVAAAAAVSVAKAAAEAAKLASEAALQAKMMADDALNAAKTDSITQNTETTNVGKNLVILSPTSILKGKDKIEGSSSIISAAREAARRRVEAASAATKRAENLYAILKAAELAVEAVSQAGTVIAMGDPLPFSVRELVEAGPEGYWKIKQATIGSVKETNNVQVEENLICGQDIDAKQSDQRPISQKEKPKVVDVEGMSMDNELSMQSEENDAGRDIGNASSIVPSDSLARDSQIDNTHGSSMQKGSLVEVAAVEDGLRGAWFSAWVLDLKDGKAYVCYKDLLSDEGRGQLNEWIPLECSSDKAPRIRIAHPLTVVKSEGTRKRRREAVCNHTWAVGDRVDAWVREGWWEGIVTEKSLEDETKLTVYFPAGGDSSFVRSWNLRPSLIWKDGQWLEWTRVRESDTLDANQGDTPVEKRRKANQLEAKGCTEMDEGRANALKSVDMNASRKLEESSTLNLSQRDKIFSVGNNVKDGNAATLNKVKRTGLQKGGSRVIFGVPKPGKKRKFMEVSKHYTSEKTNKLNEVGDSMKFTKYLTPKVPHLWRNNLKDVKGKQVTDSKHSSKPLRPQNVHPRGRLEKDNSSVVTMSVVNGGEICLSSLTNLRTFSKEDVTGRKKQSFVAGSCSNVREKVDIPEPKSSLPPLPLIASSKKKSSATAEQTSGKGKDLPSVDESMGSEDKISEDKAKTADEVTEPRRSRRRIQPTSRLLEGLQSSLTMTKIPSVSHDKGAKGLRRGVSSSRGHGHG